MIVCNYCGKILGAGDLQGFAFCNDTCIFLYAVKIPLDTVKDEKIQETTTMGDRIILATKK
jgi:hypothetical protein